MATATSKLGVILQFDDGSEVLLHEGDLVKDLQYTPAASNEPVTISGTVRVIQAVTKAYNGGPDTCPPDPYIGKYITASTLIIDRSLEYEAIIEKVPINKITAVAAVVSEDEKDFDVVVGPGAEFQSLSDVLAKAEEGANIKLLAGEYTEALNLTKSVNITGVAGTVLTKGVTVDGAAPRAASAEPFDVKISGVTLTGDALIDVKSADSFTMTNCTMQGVNTTETKGYAVKLGSGAMKVVIENNQFKPSAVAEGKDATNMYNGIESNAKLKNGSSISGNVFAAGFVTHNPIGVYDIEDGATVKVNNNTFETSGMRIGPKGPDAVGTFEIKGNKLGAYDNEWNDFVLCQPYSKTTGSWKGITLNFSNTEMNGRPLVFLYNGYPEAKFGDENIGYPVVTVDGVRAEVPGKYVIDKSTIS